MIDRSVYGQIGFGNCYGCAACAHVCAQSAIAMVPNEDGFSIPQVNDACDGCGRCAGVCPRSNGIGHEPVAAYIAVARDEAGAANSSSGGVFWAMARHVVEDLRGAVCGAVYTTDYGVAHRVTDTLDGVRAMQGSKYVQSDLSGVYADIEARLRRGQTVLFSGTPCQVAGLHGGLRADDSSLLCVDIVCHGVPSPALFRDHMREAYGPWEALEGLAFRTKDQYDRYGFNLRLHYQDKRSPRLIAGEEDAYYRLFLRGRSFRAACYRCRFAARERFGDLTIGDSGNSKKHTGFFPDKTLSAVFINTPKGTALWSALAPSLHHKAVSIDEEAGANRQMNHPTPDPGTVAALYADVREDPLRTVAARYAPGPSFPQRAKLRLKRVIPEKARHRVLRSLQRLRGRHGNE